MSPLFKLPNLLVDKNAFVLSFLPISVCCLLPKTGDSGTSKWGMSTIVKLVSFNTMAEESTVASSVSSVPSDRVL